jgi:hypothetical protein
MSVAVVTVRHLIGSVDYFVVIVMVKDEVFYYCSMTMMDYPKTMTLLMEGESVANVHPVVEAVKCFGERDCRDAKCCVAAMDCVVASAWMQMTWQWYCVEARLPVRD